jgi:hypothetical protein
VVVPVLLRPGPVPTVETFRDFTHAPATFARFSSDLKLSPSRNFDTARRTHKKKKKVSPFMIVIVSSISTIEQ